MPWHVSLQALTPAFQGVFEDTNRLRCRRAAPVAAGKEPSNARTKLLGQTGPEFVDFRTKEGLHMPRTAAQNASQLLEAHSFSCASLSLWSDVQKLETRASQREPKHDPHWFKVVNVLHDPHVRPARGRTACARSACVEGGGDICLKKHFPPEKGRDSVVTPRPTRSRRCTLHAVQVTALCTALAASNAPS